MISMDLIQQTANRLIAAAHPVKIILFGSYATGTATKDSDLDLMVITAKEQNRLEEMTRLQNIIGEIGANVDVLVYSEEEANRRGQVPGTVIYWAFKEGKILYEAPH